MITIPTEGLVRPEELYTLPEIKRRSGMGVAAMRAARRAGLKVHRQGRMAYVLGRDLIDFITREGGR